MEDDLNLRKEELLKKEAELLKIENELLRKHVEMLQGFQERTGYNLNSLSMDELFEKKIMERKASECSDGTIRTYEKSKEYFSKYANERGLNTPQEVTRDHAEEFYLFMKKQIGRDGKPLKKGRVIQIYKVVKATFQYAEKRNSIIRNPFLNKVFPKSPVSDWWTDEYYYQLIDAINKYGLPSYKYPYELITRIIYTTGLRIGLLLRARVKDIYVTDEARIYLTTKRKVPKTSAIQEIRIEILNKSAKVMLFSWLDILERRKVQSEDKIFKKISRVTYSRGIQRITKKANMKYKSPHKAKHGFITKMLIKGYTSNQICQMTGNSTPRLIDEVYSHITAGDFREKIKRDLEDV